LESVGDQVSESRKTLIQLYSNYSLQALGFALVFLLSFVTILTNVDKVKGIGPFGLNLSYGLLVTFPVLAFVMSLRFMLWSAVTTFMVHRPPPFIDPAADAIGSLSRYYVGIASSEMRSIFVLGFSLSALSVMLVAAIVFLIAAAIGPSTGLIYP
jgi:hypothetical protein